MSDNSQGRVRQVVSALAVVLSLLFVGMELRQNTLAQRAQTRQELANASRDLILTITENPSIARAYSVLYGAMGGYSDSTLSALDSLQGRWAMFANIRNLENVWLQSQAGVVDESVLSTYGFRSAVLYQSDEFRRMWRTTWSLVFDSSFVRAFEAANQLRD